LPSGIRSAQALTPSAVSTSIDFSAASTPAASASKHRIAREATLRSSRACSGVNAVPSAATAFPNPAWCSAMQSR